MKVELKKVKCEVMSLDDLHVDPQYLKSVLDSVSNCNGRLSSIKITNSELEQKLKEENIIKISHHGGAYPGDKFNEFKTKVEELI